MDQEHIKFLPDTFSCILTESVTLSKTITVCRCLLQLFLIKATMLLARVLYCAIPDTTKLWFRESCKRRDSGEGGMMARINFAWQWLFSLLFQIYKCQGFYYVHNIHIGPPQILSMIKFPNLAQPCFKFRPLGVSVMSTRPQRYPKYC